jgi:hypothetical protein
MSTYPMFYFSSKKENPKTNINLNIKNNSNNIPVIEFNSDLNLDFKINDEDYLLNISIILKFEQNKEPVINITHLVRDISSSTKKIDSSSVSSQQSSSITSLMSFMSEFKNKINDDVIEDSKKLDNIKTVTSDKLKNLLKFEENVKILQEQKRVLKNKKEKELLKIQENFKIEEFKEKRKLDDEHQKLKIKLKELLNFEEDVKIQNQNEIEFQEKLLEDKNHLKIMEDIKIKNYEILKKNEKYLRTEMHFESDEIISYLKNELENLDSDAKELDNDQIESEKLKYFKEKYGNSSENEIIVNRKDISPQLVSSSETDSNLEDTLFEHIKDIVSDNPDMIYTNLIFVITELMKFIENFNTDSFDKKGLIISSIKKFLEYEKMKSEETDIILDTICPELIEILLLVDKRKIIIRKKLNCFLPFCN